MATNPSVSDYNVLPPAPIRTPFLDSNGFISSPWVMYFQKLNLRAGGNISPTVDQNAAAIAALSALDSVTDKSAEGNSSADPLSFLDTLAFLDPIPSKEVPDDQIAEFIQNIDFETGPWVPTISNTIITGTVTIPGGVYTRIGNQIFFDFNVSIAVSSSFQVQSSSVMTMPYAANYIRSNCFVINGKTLATLGNGIISGSSVFLSPFTVTTDVSTPQDILFTGRYLAP